LDRRGRRDYSTGPLAGEQLTVGGAAGGQVVLA